MLDRFLAREKHIQIKGKSGTFITEKLYQHCIFLRDISFLTSIELILKLYEEFSSSQKNFPKSQT